MRGSADDPVSLNQLNTVHMRYVCVNASYVLSGDIDFFSFLFFNPLSQEGGAAGYFFLLFTFYSCTFFFYISPKNLEFLDVVSAAGHEAEMMLNKNRPFLYEQSKRHHWYSCIIAITDLWGSLFH